MTHLLQKYFLLIAYLSLSITAFLLLLNGCAENDGNVGGSIIDPGINGNLDDTLFVPVTVDTFYSRQVNSGQSLHLYVGQYTGFQTKTLLRFTNFSALPDSFILDSAEIKLTMSGFLGDTSIGYPNFTAQVRQALDVTPSDSWSESNVMWDSVIAWSDTILFNIDCSASSDTDSVIFTIDNTIVNQWINADTSSPNTGLIIDYSSESQFIRQFHSFETSNNTFKPQLMLFITPYDSIADSGWVAQTADTIISYANNDVFICIDTTMLPNDRVYLSRGMARRVIFRFDIADLFPVFGTYINKAEYTVYIDTSNSLNFGTYSTITASKITDDSWYSDLSEVNYTVSSSDKYSTISGDSIKLDITALIRHWVAYPDSNFGMVVRFSVEGGEMARVPIFPSEYSDPAKVPYLYIIYSRGFN